MRKVIPIRRTDLEETVDRVLELERCDKLRAVVIVYQEEETVSYYWNGSARCVEFLGMLEYAKEKIQRYLNEHDR